MKELTKDGAKALTELQEDARRHANVLTIWLTTIDGMKKAKAAAKGGKTIEEAAKEKGVTIPPAEWKTRVLSWVTLGEKEERKLKKLLPQAEGVFKPLEKKLTDEFNKDNKIKDDVAVMKKCIEKIGSYINDVAAWLDKIKKSADQVEVV